MGIISSIAHFLSEYWGLLLGLFFLIWKGKELYLYFVLQPLRGGNGVVQMDEFAKYVMMVLLIYMVYREGQDESHYYDVSVFWAMVVGAFLIAGIKEFAQVLPKIFKGND